MMAPGSRIARVLLLSLLTLAAAPASAGRNLWTPRGPLGPTGAGATDVVFDPRSPSTLWISAWGKLYKSEDGGMSVRKVESVPEDLGIGSLAIDPGRPDVLYTNTYRAGDSGQSLYRSVDGGAHWTQVLVEEFLTIWSFAVAPGPPGQPGVVFVGGDSKLFRSGDGGASFQASLDLDGELFSAVAPDFQNPGTVYAATQGQCFKSTDFGVTWTLIEADTDIISSPSFNNLVIAPGDSERLYTTSGISATWRSRDGGATWEGPFDHGFDVLAADSEDASTVYAGSSEGLFVSHDAGETFTQAVRGMPPLDIGVGSYTVSSIRTDSAHPGYALAVTMKGVYATADHGATWRALPLRGLKIITPVHHIRIDPFDPAHWILSSQGTFVESRDSGRTITLFANRLQHQAIFSDVQFDPLVRNRLWALVWPLTRLFVSTDGGATWTSRGRAPGFGREQLMLPAPGEMLIAGSGLIYRSTDFGRSWHQVYVPRGSDDARFWRLQQDPRNPRAIYGPGLRSPNAGRDWYRWQEYDAIGFDHFRPRNVHIARGDTLYISRDGGASFQVVGHFGLGEFSLVNELLFDRVRPNVVYAVTTHDGLLRSRDGGATWEPLDEGLPPFLVGDYPPLRNLIQDPVHGQRFYICPDWNGIYEASFPGGS